MTRFAASLIVSYLAVAGIVADHEVHLSEDRNFLRKQEFVYQLFWSPDDLLESFPDIVEKAKNFKVEDLQNAAVDKNAAKDFIECYHSGLLPRGRSCTAFYAPHMTEIKSFFDVLYSAQDFETFAVISTWSKQVLNEILWFFAVAVTVFQRHDTRHLRVPNVHETLPQYFYNNDVLAQFNRTKNNDEYTTKDNVILAKYSDIVSRLHGVDYEARLSYFTEDVGLSNFYFYQALDVPFFMSSRDYNVASYRRGERYFNDHKMFLARYYLERLSNGLGLIENLDWDENILTGYHPNMADYNGIHFPQRPHNSPVPSFKKKFLQLIKQFENRLITAADTGKLKGSKSDSDGNEFFDELMNAVQGNADSVDQEYYGSYDTIARHILGFNPEPKDQFNYIISAMENLNADVRDPAFYRMYKKIVDIGLRYKSRLPAYTSQELSFPNVYVNSIAAKAIETFFDEFDAILGYQKYDDSNNNDEKRAIIVKQKRLNHRTFDIRIKVSSEISTKAVVRIFLGPKFDEHGKNLKLKEAQHGFFQLDQFVVDLKMGATDISRSDADFGFQVPDDPRSDDFYDYIQKSLVNENQGLAVHERPYGWPRRLLIPRGTAKGLTLHLFVIVNNFDEDKAVRVDSLVAGKGLLDGRSLGFPFDRPVDGDNFEGGNFAFEDVVVYHRG